MTPTKFIDEFRDVAIAQRLLAEIRRRRVGEVQFMEVCGTHAHVIARHGLGRLLPSEVRLLSGPGCPVCVTPTGDIDAAIELAREENLTLATFGDMMRVPGAQGSLEGVKAQGADVKVVYSVLDALDQARRQAPKPLVFLGVGFETTAPSIACAALEAKKLAVQNFFVLSCHKLIPPAMKALLDLGEVRISGFICPGHVSTIIGALPYQFIPEKYNVPCAIAGFEPVDILQGIHSLLRQIEKGEPRVDIQYSRAVRPEGNKFAQDIMDEVFERGDATWRGLGNIAKSGLSLREEYADLDAARQFDLEVKDVPEPPGCRCGEILRGVMEPEQCGLFGKVCTPQSPVGPCMVSSEGACAARFRYRDVRI